MKLIGSKKQHRGIVNKFGRKYEWIHWIRPDGVVVIVASELK